MRVYASAEMTLTDTNDGVSVTGIDRYYMASSSSEGITVDSKGWQPDPQETNPISRYHWSYELVNYSDGAKIPSKPAVIGVYGKDGKEGVDAVTVSLSSEAHTFAGTDSKAIASSITIDVYAFKGSQRIPTSIGTVTGGISGQLTHSELGKGTTNNKLVINATSALAKGNGTLSIPIVADGRTFHKVFSWSVAFKGIPGEKGDTGPQGPRGATGSQGPRGNTGTSVKSVTEYYLATSVSSGIKSSNTGFKTTMQPMTATNKYLWNYEKINFSDGTSQPTIPVIIGVYGDKGQTGSTGATGRSISSITEHYLATSANSGVTRNTSGWDTKMQPTTETNRYLWNYETIKWSSAPLTTYVDPIIIGVHGAKGPQGIRGPQGIQGPKGSNGQSQWVHIRYSPNPTGSGMTTSPSSTTKYVGIVVTNSATVPAFPEFTWSKYVGENGDRGPQGVKGDKGLDTYTWIKYADEKDGTGINNFPAGKKFIGLAYNKTTPNESNNPKDYQWSAMYDEEAFKGVGLADKIEILSGKEIYTDKADNAVVHVDVDGKSYQSETGENLSVNGDFSNDLTGWSANGTVTINNVDGIKAIKLTGKSGGFYQYPSKNIPGFYEISFKAKSVGSSSSIRYGFLNGGGGAYTSQTITNSWETYSFRTTVEFDKRELYHFYASNNTNEGVYITDISVRVVGQSPDNPIEIHNLNDFEVVSGVGKNMFSVDNFILDNINRGYSHISRVEHNGNPAYKSTAISSNHLVPRYLEGEGSFKKNTQYTLSWNVDFLSYTHNNASYSFLMYYTDGTYTSSGIGTNNSNRAVLTSKPGKTVSHISTSRQYSGDVIVYDVQLNEGSEPFEYSASSEDITESDSHPLIDKINILLDKPLRSVGDVKDRLFRDSDGLWKVERNVGEIILDGSSSFTRYSTSYDTDLTSDRSFNEFNGITTGINRNSKTSHFVIYGSVWTTDVVGYTFNGSSQFHVNFPNNLLGISSSDDRNTRDTKIRNWLNNERDSGRPFTVIYELKNKITETLDQELQDKLNNLRSFQDSNYVYTVINDKADTVSENLKPTLHATFKGGGWYSRWKAEDELEKHQDELEKHQDQLDKTIDTDQLNTVVADINADKLSVESYESFLSSYEGTLDEVNRSIGDVATDIGKALSKTSIIETTLGEGAQDWLFTNTKIRMSDEGITLGDASSGTYLQISSERISFFAGATDEVAYVSGGMLYINKAIFVQSIQVAEYLISKELDGHLTYRFVGMV